MEKWVSYDSEFDGKTSVVQVDLRPVSSAAERKRLPMLLMLRIALRKNYAAAMMSYRADRRLTRELKALGRFCPKVNVALVAARTWGSALLIYAYAADEPSLMAAVKLCEKQRSLAVDYDIRYDPEWRIYRAELYPNAAARQTMKNAEQIEMMERYGDDLHAPRRINHYCSFPDEPSRIGFEQTARQSGFALGDPFFLAEKDYPYCMCVRHVGSIDKRTIDGYTNKVVRIAEQFGGHYDYWDCQIMRKTKLHGSGRQKSNAAPKAKR